MYWGLISRIKGGTDINISGDIYHNRGDGHYVRGYGHYVRGTDILSGIIDGGNCYHKRGGRTSGEGRMDII